MRSSTNSTIIETECMWLFFYPNDHVPTISFFLSKAPLSQDALGVESGIREAFSQNRIRRMCFFCK